MKKVIAIILCSILISTNISFAAPSPTVKNSLGDLSRVENDISIVLKSVLNSKYDADSLKKTLKFDGSILSNVYTLAVNDLSTTNLTSLEKRELITLIYTTSLFGLAINGLVLYLDDPQANQSFYFDAISEYKLGRVSLRALKDLY